MPADPRFYESERLAHAYAHHRPRLHPLILSRAMGLIPGNPTFSAALDIGCGAGVSTAALANHVRSVTGIDPFPNMLLRAKTALPQATWIEGTVQAIPCPSGSFPLVTTAGALNYAEPEAALAEIARVLAPGGYFVAYDFSCGQLQPATDRSSRAWSKFVEQFPSPGGYGLDLRQLPYVRFGMSLIAFDQFPIVIPMQNREYIQYLLSETGVERVLAGGMEETAAEALCQDIFGGLFAGTSCDVTFAAELVVARKKVVETSDRPQPLDAAGDFKDCVGALRDPGA